MSSVGVAAWIAELAFWAILGLGVAFGEIGRRGAAAAVVLWAAGFFGLPRIAADAAPFVTPYVAVLDIVLVFIVFKGDVTMS